jgi:polysaccharide biosynthesis transport protein
MGGSAARSGSLPGGRARAGHGKRFILRTPTTGCAGKLFQTLGVALPPNIRDAHRYLLERPLSAYAESLRSLQLAMRCLQYDRLPQVIQLTSSVPDEGKTSLASGCLTCARRQARAAVRAGPAPAEHRGPGRGGRGRRDRPAPLFSEVRHDGRSGLDLILVRRPPSNPQAILTSDALARALRHLRQRYDHVIVDSPPLLGLSDSKFVASLVDATLLVIRSTSPDQSSSACLTSGR